MKKAKEKKKEKTEKEKLKEENEELNNELQIQNYKNRLINDEEFRYEVIMQLERIKEVLNSISQQLYDLNRIAAKNEEVETEENETEEQGSS